MAESATNVYEMDDPELIAEIHSKLSAVDNALSGVFKTHVPMTDDAGTLTPLEHSVHIMRNLENTMNELRSTNPMVLIKQLMGL